MLFLNEERKTAEEVIKTLGIKFDMGKRIEFMVHDSRIKYDKDNDKITYPQETVSDFTINFTTKEGVGYSLAYTKQTPKRTPQGLQFTGTPPAMRGLYMGINKQDEEYALFMFLHPRNVDSPFFDKNKQPWWKVNDKNKKAKANNEKRNALRIALDMVENMSAQEAATALKGFGALTKDMTTEEIKDSLGNRAQANPDAFIEGINNPENKVRSIIQSAIDKGLVKTVNHGGAIKWETADGLHLCNVPYNADITDALLTAAVANHAEVFKPISDALKDRTRFPKEKEDKQDVSLKEAVLDAIDSGVITKFGAKKFFINTGGEKKVTIEVSGDKPMKELVEKIAANQELINAVTGIPA